MIRRLVKTHFGMMLLLLFVGIACLVLLAMNGTTAQ